MGTQHTEITDSLIEFIKAQKLFFVGTADREGRVNISPKGSDSLRVLDKNRVVWLNLTGSGNETAAHMKEHNRITIMFCSFEKKPMILRLYGNGKAVYPQDPQWENLYEHFPKNIGARQIFDIHVDLIQDSCGFQVPYFDFQGERNLLDKWSQKIGIEGIQKYQQEKNKLSIDGKPTGL